MHPLKTLLALALLIPSMARAASEDWETIGLRVAPREVVTQVGPRVLPYVAAVQDQSPAFFAGVQPGDVISFVRCGSWAWNYIDNTGTGATHYQSHSSVSATDFGDLKRYVDTRRACSRTDLGGLISVSRLENDPRKVAQFLEFRTMASTGGPWFTSKAMIGPAAAEARAVQTAALARLHARATVELRKSPCSYRVSNAYNTASMPPLVQEMVKTARFAGTEEDVLFWRDALWSLCSDEKNGALPSFETAVYLMSTGALQPCDYDPDREYRIPLDYDKRQRPISWDEYERMKDLNYMFRRNDATQHACFFKAVRGELGRP